MQSKGKAIAYRLLYTDPTTKLEINFKKILKKPLNVQDINKQARRWNRFDVSNIAQLYGPLKLHRDGISLRPLVYLKGALKRY